MRLGSFLAAMLLCAVSTGVFAAGQTKTLVVNQKVGLAEEGYQTSFLARYGTPRFSTKSGVTLNRDSSTDLNPSSITQIPPINYDPTAPLTQSQILLAADGTFQYYVNDIANEMKAYMAPKGVSTGIYNYGQRITVKGAIAPKVLVWQVMVDTMGRVRYGKARLIDESPLFVYALYTPLKVAEGLPSSWAYPNAGMIQWQMVDAEMLAATAMQTIDVAGVYDAPYATENQAPPLPAGCAVNSEDGAVYCNPDFGLECFINKQSHADCPTGHPDVMQLIDENGASGAFVDYGRKLQPVYDEIEDPPGSENYTRTARVAVSVTERKWIPGKRFFFIAPGGGARYLNSGTVGYELLSQVDRYRVEVDGQWQIIGTNISNDISPTLTYSKSVTLKRADKCIDFQYKIIDPFETLTVYDYRNDTVNFIPLDKYLSVAPITGCS